MKIVIDNDVFSKLAAWNLITPTLSLFDANLSDCGRLPTLPYLLLNRGPLRRKLGADLCERLQPIADSMPAIPSEDPELLNRLIGIPGIDVGEAQLFAHIINQHHPLITGDKRSMEALKGLTDLHAALSGRVIPLEGVLIALCDKSDPLLVRDRINAVLNIDGMTSLCFPPTTTNPLDCLLSYYGDIVKKVEPLTLWNPRS